MCKNQRLGLNNNFNSKKCIEDIADEEVCPNPQAESALHFNVPSKKPAYSAKHPDGKLPYA